MLYKAIFLLWFFLFAAGSFSQVSPLQSPAYKRSLTVSDGLPQGRVQGIVQDRQGFIWIASEGLSRYDGRTVLNFYNALDDTASLADDEIIRLQIDDQDNLWITYASGEVDEKNLRTGRGRHVSAEPAFRWLLASSTGYAIRQAGGRYFAATWNSLIAFDPITGKHNNIPLPTGEKLLALGGNVTEKALLATPRALYEIKGNELRRVTRFPAFSDATYNHWDSVIMGHGQVNNAGYTLGKIIAYRSGNLAISALYGLFLFDRQQKHTSYFAYPNPVLSQLPYPLVLAADSNVYSSFATGIYRISGTQPPELVCSIDKKETSNGFLFADRSGMLWVDAGVLGIRLFNLLPENFHSFPQQRNFAEDVLQPWIAAPDKNYHYGSYQLRLAKDTSGNVWVLNNAHGTVRGDNVSLICMPGSFQSIKQYFRERNVDPIYFTFDDLNQCWLVFQEGKTRKRTLAKINLHTGAVLPFVQLPEEWQENGYLTAIGNKLCYLTEDGIRLYDRLDSTCIVYPNKKLGVKVLLLMAVPDRQQKDILWIATKSSGMVQLNITTGATVHFTMANGLPNNTVYFIAPDKQGLFWCSSNKGLFRFNPANGSVQSFTVEDGLQGNEFNRYHFLETPDGHFIFGGTEGYTVFHPDSVQIDDYQPPVAITSVLVNNLPLQQTDPVWKDSAITTLQQLTLAYNQNFLTFSFAGLQYNAPEKLQYRYQLQGIDKDWVVAGTDASARYASIPPGRYTFIVNASNTAGIWSGHIKKLAITILPPWWKTGWAYAIYALLIAGTGYALYRVWLQRAQYRQQVILKQKEAEQAQAMEETKSRFFANITHELRTPLTLILSPVQRQLQEGEETYSPVLLKNVYHQSQLLLRQINQLLDMSKLESGRLPLQLSQGSIVLFIEQLVSGFKSTAQAKRIDLLYEADAARFADAYLFDSDKLEKVLYNLLGNALKFTPEGGRVRVETGGQKAAGRVDPNKQEISIHNSRFEPAEAEKNMIQIKVSDTGIGIAPEHLPHIFDRFYQVNSSTTRRYEGTGIGLSLVKELTGLMGGTIQAESVIGKGTVFTLTLLLSIAGAAHFPEVSHPAVVESISRKEEEQPTQPAATASSLPLVLITEDNEPLRLFIQQCLQPQHRVLTAANGAEGLQAAVAELPDLIISDVMMPVMDGYEFCSQVKENPLTAHIGFIMLTAKRANDSRIGGLRLGADHYLGKPFLVEELLLVSHNLLQRQQKLRELYSRQLGPAGKLPPVSEVDDSFLRSVYTIIEAHLDRPELDVDFLAGELAVSRRTLNRKLATVADTSANDIIRNYRLKKAADLLLQGHNVSSAAYATGFTTPSYFTRCFKELYGHSPVQYAESRGL